MPDRTNDPAWPTPRGPWPEVTDIDRVFDHGAPWCINASGHAGDDDYPDQARHFPPYECRTRGLVIDAVDGLSGPQCDLEIYAARTYRFGELRTAASPEHTRVLFNLYDETNDRSPRFSVAAGDAVRIALHLLAVVRDLDGS